MVQGVQAAKDGAARARGRAPPRGDRARPEPLGGALRPRRRARAARATSRGAEEQLAAAAKLAPDSQEVAVALGRGAAAARRAQGAPPRGSADFVQDHPNAVDARTLYVAALRESGQVDKAIAEAREVLVRKPADATALAELALSHLAKGEREAAALLAKQALDANPNSAVAHRATGLLDLAERRRRRGVRRVPQGGAGRPARHDVAPQHGRRAPQAPARTRRPRSSTARSCKVSPDDVEAAGRASRRRCAARPTRSTRRSSKRRAALLEKVLAANPHDTSALFNLGVLYADFLKRPADAAPLFKRFLVRRAERPPAARRGREVHVGGGGQRSSAASVARVALGQAAPPARRAGDAHAAAREEVN